MNLFRRSDHRFLTRKISVHRFDTFAISWCELMNALCAVSRFKVLHTSIRNNKNNDKTYNVHCLHSSDVTPQWDRLDGEKKSQQQ